MARRSVYEDAAGQDAREVAFRGDRRRASAQGARGRLRAGRAQRPDRGRARCRGRRCRHLAADGRAGREPAASTRWSATSRRFRSRTRPSTASSRPGCSTTCPTSIAGSPRSRACSAPGGRLVAVTNTELHLEEAVRSCGRDRWSVEFRFAGTTARSSSASFRDGRPERRRSARSRSRRRCGPPLRPLDVDRHTSTCVDVGCPSCRSSGSSRHGGCAVFVARDGCALTSVRTSADDPPGRPDRAEAQRRGARRRRARRARARLRARRGAGLPDGGVVHGRLLQGPDGGRDVRAHRRDDPLRRHARPRRGARAQGRRQALDGRAWGTRRRSRSARSWPPAACRSGR